MRVLVLDPDGRVLLFNDSDLGTGHTCWITPGGGIDAGETELNATTRELAEETGHHVAASAVLGPVARRHVVHGYSDQIVEQDDTFYAIRVAAFDVDTSGHTADEQLTLLGSRWWTPAEIRGTHEEIWPANLLDLVALLDEESIWPVLLPTVEESSVPDDRMVVSDQRPGTGEPGS